MRTYKCAKYYLLSYVNIHRLVVQKKKKRTCFSTLRVQSLSVDPLVIYTLSRLVNLIMLGIFYLALKRKCTEIPWLESRIFSVPNIPGINIIFCNLMSSTLKIYMILVT